MLAILWLRVQRNVASRLSPLSGRPCGDDLSSDDGARCGMDGFFEAGALSGLSTGVPRRFGVDWAIGRMPAVAGKKPEAGFSWESAPMLAQFVE